MKEFPRILAAVQRRDKSQWEIGDELIAACGKPSVPGAGGRDGSFDRIRQVSEYLLGCGHDYSIVTLAQYREIAFDFPKSRRHAHLSFGAHKSAGSPDVLDAIVAGAKGKKFGPDYVIAVRAAQRRVEEEEREKEREAARREAEKAEREIERTKSALHDAEQAKKPEIRRKLDEAKERLQAARATAKTPPKRMTGKPKADDMPALVIEVGVLADFSRAAVLIRTVEKKLTAEVIAQLRPSMVNSLREDALSAMNTWKRIADRLATVATDKRGHLYAVGE